MTPLIVFIFVIGYTAIALEHSIHINKAAAALITGVLCWTVVAITSPDSHHIIDQLQEHLGDLSGILFFLLGAMTIVELIDAHEGFNLITNRIASTSKRQLLWIISGITFLLSPLLDNLTTTIVMVSLLRKLIPSQEDRLSFTGMIVIAANAGGAWSPIGDVTTTMLWIGGQITATAIITTLLLPSLVCLLVPLAILTLRLKGKVLRPAQKEKNISVDNTQQSVIFFCGAGMLIMVPVFKSATQLPPYMGILLALGVLWIITSIMHGRKPDADQGKFSVTHALRKIDSPSILFFLGILLSISALQTNGTLAEVARWSSVTIPSYDLLAITTGLLSAVVDNVPLVAAAQGMFDLQAYPTDHYFWKFLAYTTGTGGSALIIGSAAGVAAMGMEKITFMWYLRKISFPALLGFLAGAVVFIVQHKFGR